MHKQPTDPVAASEALKFFNWAYASGGKMAEELHYVPMPASVIGAVQTGGRPPRFASRGAG